MSRQSTLVLCITSALVNVLGARILDALGLIEGLLSPSGWRPLLIVPLSLAFYGARLFVYFIAPGLLLAELWGLLSLAAGSNATANNLPPVRASRLAIGPLI